MIKLNGYIGSKLSVIFDVKDGAGAAYTFADGLRIEINKEWNKTPIETETLTHSIVGGKSLYTFGMTAVETESVTKSATKYPFHLFSGDRFVERGELAMSDVFTDNDHTETKQITVDPITLQITVSESDAAALVAVAAKVAAEAAQTAINELYTDISKYGLSTTADSSTNVIALNQAVQNHRFVTVTKPGIYLVNGAWIIPSNTKIDLAPGVIFKREAGFNAFFVNEKAFTGVWNDMATWDSNIEVNNLEIDCANASATVDTANYHNGHVMMANVKNLRINNLTISDMPIEIFGFHLASVQHMYLNNYKVEGRKDGITGFSNCRYIYIDGIDGSTHDDLICLATWGYTTRMKVFGDCRDIFIKNVVDRLRTSTVGFTVRLLIGSWKEWVSGNSYMVGDVIINNGKLYQKYNVGTQISGNEPIHAEGRVLYADGIEWAYKQDASFLNTIIENIHFDNFSVESERRFLIQDYLDATYGRSVYPDSSGGVIDNIYINGYKYDTDTPSTIGIFKASAPNVQNFYINRLVVPNEQPFAYIYTETAGYMKNLHLSNFKCADLPVDNASSLVRSFEGTIENIFIDGVSFEGMNDGALHLGTLRNHIHDRDATTKYIEIKNSNYNWTQSLYRSNTDNDIEIVCENVKFLNTKAAVLNDRAGNNFDLRFINCEFDDPNDYLFNNPHTTAGMTVQARVCKFANYIKIASINVTGDWTDAEHSTIRDGDLAIFDNGKFKPIIFSSYVASFGFLHEDTEAYIDRMTTKPDFYYSMLYDGVAREIIKALKIDNLSDRVDLMYLFAGHSANESLLNVVKAAHNCTLQTTNAVLPAFTTNRGWLGDGATAYINTNYNPFTDSVNYLSDNAFYGIYSQTNQASNSVGDFGCFESSTKRIFGGLQLSAGNSRFYMNSGGTNDGPVLNDSRGLYTMSRIATDLNLQINDASTQFSRTFEVLPNVDLYVLAYNNTGNPTGFSGKQISFFCMGGGLTGAEQIKIHDIIMNKYLKPIGAKVI